MNNQLSEQERSLLLKIARQAISEALHGRKPPSLNLQALPLALQQRGASFVTLTRLGQLRGCIGALEPYQPLAEDVSEHAVAAALEDFRFPPVVPEELAELSIEISRLTVASPIDYEGPVDLLEKLHPGIDGVIIKDGAHRATFLPQVWEKLPNKADFLGQLCMKMGGSADLWRRKKIQVLVYQVEEFHE